MSRVPTKPVLLVVCTSVLGLLAISATASAQDQSASPAQDQAPPAADQAPPAPNPPPTPGWHRFSQSPPRPAADNAKPDTAQDPNNAQPNSPDPGNDPADTPPDTGIPSRLTLTTGTFVTVRVDQFLSSDRNHPGDGFSATLTRPLVVDGVVVAERGQTVGGRVVETQKAGRVKGVSRLSVQLTELTLVDGHQVPIRTQLANLTGPTSKARDAVAIGSTSATGAGIGAAVASSAGAGAAIGAGAGALAGTLGVLLTRGRPTVIYPESVLTFRLSAPVSFSTDRAPQAFRYVDTSEYEQTAEREGPPPARYACGYGCPPPPPYGYYAPYPYYWGPRFSFWFGRGFHHRHYYGRGFYGRGYYGRGFRGRRH